MRQEEQTPHLRRLVEVLILPAVPPTRGEADGSRVDRACMASPVHSASPQQARQRPATSTTVARVPVATNTTESGLSLVS